MSFEAGSETWYLIHLDWSISTAIRDKEKSRHLSAAGLLIGRGDRSADQRRLPCLYTRLGLEPHEVRAAGQGVAMGIAAVPC